MPSTDAKPAAKKGPPRSARRRSREFALQGLYEWLLSREAGAQRRCDRRAHPRDAGLRQGGPRALPRAAARRDRATSATLRAAIAPHLDRPIAELSPVEHAVLLIGAYELVHHLEIPYRVVHQRGGRDREVVRRHRRLQVRQRRARQARRRPATERSPRAVAALTAARPAIDEPGRAASFPAMNEFELIGRWFDRPVAPRDARHRRRLRAARADAGPRARDLDRHAGRRSPLLRRRRAGRARLEDARRQPVGPRRDGRRAARVHARARVADDRRAVARRVRARPVRMRRRLRLRTRRRRHHARAADAVRHGVRRRRRGPRAAPRRGRGRRRRLGVGHARRRATRAASRTGAARRRARVDRCVRRREGRRDDRWLVDRRPPARRARPAEPARRARHRAGRRRARRDRRVGRARAGPRSRARRVGASAPTIALDRLPLDAALRCARRRRRRAARARRRRRLRAVLHGACVGARRDRRDRARGRHAGDAHRHASSPRDGLRLVDRDGADRTASFELRGFDHFA